MAISAGMTSAIMNPVTLPTKLKDIEAKKLQLVNAGFQVPEDIDPNIFAKLTGLGSVETSSSKEMEAINAANFLMNKDPHGAQWIKTNKIESSQQGGRSRRESRRRK